MTDKQLKDKAVDIKGKKYVLVADRVVYFNETYKEGSIATELVSDYDSSLIVVKAMVRPDSSDRCFTGYSQATVGDGMVNKTAALENAETSAVGRALAMMGIGVIESIASADEMNKATFNRTPNKPRNASMKQIELMVNKVKWGLKVNDKDQVINFLERVLEKPLTDIKSDEVDEALGKIDTALREEKIASVPSLEEPEIDVVHPDTGEPISLGALPY